MGLGVRGFVERKKGSFDPYVARPGWVKLQNLFEVGAGRYAVGYDAGARRYAVEQISGRCGGNVFFRWLDELAFLLG